jgi:site-specific DNA recombinase
VSRLQVVPAAAPRAVLYLRQSVSRDDSISLELQETACRDYCARRGYLVTEVIADPGISGRTWKRPGVQRTLDMIENGQAEVIVLWRWSRLSRSRRDWAVAVDRIEVAGGRIESATEPVDTTTAAGRLQRGMLAELAAWESDVKGEQWRETHDRRRRNGLPHNGGYRPGYVYEGKAYRPHPDTAPLVREAYERYVDGWGLRPLAQWMTAVGIASRATRTADAWTPRGVGSTLDTGWAAGLLHVHDSSCRCRDADTCSRRVWIAGAHEPIISGKLWAAYRRERQRRSASPRRLLAPTTPLAGLVRCAACQYGMRLKKGRTPGGDYYACDSVGCPRPTSVVRSRAETAALAWLAGWVHDVERSADIAATERAARAASKAAVTRLARTVAQLDAELTKLTRAFSRGVVPENAYLATRDELVSERAAAQAALDEATSKVGPATPPRSQAFTLLDEWEQLGISARNATLRALLRVVVSRGQWRSEVRVWPAWEWPPPS